MLRWLLALSLDVVAAGMGTVGLEGGLLGSTQTSWYRGSKLSSAKTFSLLFPWLLAITNLQVTLTFPFSSSRSSQYL